MIFHLNSSGLLQRVGASSPSSSNASGFPRETSVTAPNLAFGSVKEEDNEDDDDDDEDPAVLLAKGMCPSLK